MMNAPHPLDLPRLHTRPEALVLLDVLDRLVVPPPSWDRPSLQAAEIALASHAQTSADAGLAHWLTRLIGNDLWWIEDEDVKEQIWSSASKRLAERCGRTAAPAMTRSFNVPRGDGDATVAITLHEPPLTSDSMGLKTWASSYLLAKRLHHLVPSVAPQPRHASALLSVLEMGSGTGLVGLSAAALFQAWHLHLTDLPEVVPNLANNIVANQHLFTSTSSTSSSTSPSSTSLTAEVPRVVARVLDWTQPLADEYWNQRVGSFDVILASDPLYTPQHPALVVSCVTLFLRKPAEGDDGGKFILEHPLRPTHMTEVADCEALLTAAGLVREAVGEEVGWDDWGVSHLQQERLRLGNDNNTNDHEGPQDSVPEEAELLGGVRCRWGVWRWRTQADNQ